MSDLDVPGIIERYHQETLRLTVWKETVVAVLQNDSVFQSTLKPIALKSRLKTDESVAKKVRQKHDPEMRPICPESLIEEIEDLVGVRLVLAHKGHIQAAVDRIHELSEERFWYINSEEHYCWHPDEIRLAYAAGIDSKTKEFPYCSRHFILCKEEPTFGDDGSIRCELQVRTILEEAIFENDHRIRYKGNLDSATADSLKRLSQNLETADQQLLDAYKSSGLWSASP